MPGPGDRTYEFMVTIGEQIVIDPNCVEKQGDFTGWCETRLVLAQIGREPRALGGRP
jgi:hypothetical protein